MNETKKLLKALQNYYGNKEMGLASQVGYLTGIVEQMEREYKSASSIISTHSVYLKECLKELNVPQY